MKPIINLADAPTHGMDHGANFDFKMTQLAGPLGAKTIGANVTRVPPGKAAFPLHHHYANEEHFFILSGTGQLRYGEETHAVKSHDYIVTLAGGPEHAHQLINTGDEELVYLAISTKTAPEVVGYPDSRKTAAMPVSWGEEPGPYIVQDETKGQVSYWDREDGRAVAAALGGK